MDATLDVAATYADNFYVEVAAAQTAELHPLDPMRNSIPKYIVVGVDIKLHKTTGLVEGELHNTLANKGLPIATWRQVGAFKVEFVVQLSTTAFAPPLQVIDLRLSQGVFCKLGVSAPRVVLLLSSHSMSSKLFLLPKSRLLFDG